MQLAYWILYPGTPELPMSMARQNVIDFLKDIEDQSDTIVDKKSLELIVDEILKNTKYKHILSVYGLKVY